MKIFTIDRGKKRSIRLEIIEWCKEHIGEENVFWWYERDCILPESMFMYDKVFIENDEQELMFVLRWSDVIV